MPKRLSPIEQYRRQVLEKDLRELVREFTVLFGWAFYFTHDARRSPEGFPDLVLVRPPRVLFVELKRETEGLSREQGAWRLALRDCPGVEYFLWGLRDADEIEETLR